MRIATRQDLPRIVEIYNATVASRKATADTHVVTVEQRQAWFDAHDAASRPLLVEERDGQIIGWLSFGDFYGRPAYAATAEVSIYLDSAYRGDGIGTRMLAEAIGMAPSLGIENLVAFVFSHNTASIRLCQGLGFEAWGELPNVARMDGCEYSLSILGLRIPST